MYDETPSSEKDPEQIADHGRIDHKPAPECYFDNDLWKESPLTDDEREAMRDEIRQVVLKIKEETYVEQLNHPAISDIFIRSPRRDHFLTLTVYLSTDELEMEPIGEDTVDENGDISSSAGGHFLRDLGHTWKALEYDLISDLVVMLDLPEAPIELSGYLLDGPDHGPCLYCTFKSPDVSAFTIIAHIPNITQRIYDDADFELAAMLGIPLEKPITE